MRQLILLVIKLYQRLISPMFPPRCRYYPTCSHYAVEAVEKHGVFGVWLALKRLGRCHPYSKREYYDPVP